MKNIAEILRDCPKGMELDCTMYENVEFDYIEQSPESRYPIHCSTKTNSGYNALVFTHYGCNDRHPNAKCVIFPKGKTTWDGFQRPFKDGDIVISSRGDIHLLRTADSSYCAYRKNFIKQFDHTITTGVYVVRFATEEEKQKLFQAIKENGYKWNAETKTLEKLIEPKFKVGDRIKSKNIYINYLNDNHIFTITEISNGRYWSNRLAIEYIEKQDDWELVPNKFDITTLKAFNKVLVRDDNRQKWTVDMFSFYDKTLIYPFNCIGHYVNQCIPYENNEHLLGTTNDCDEYYKTW